MERDGRLVAVADPLVAGDREGRNTVVAAVVATTGSSFTLIGGDRPPAVTGDESVDAAAAKGEG
jgi:hypothetical protein